MSALQIIGTIVSGIAQMRAAQAEQVQYEMKARNEEIRGRTAAGGLNPYASGESADLINTYSLNVGVGDSGLARTNAMLALDASKRNASQFRTAGKYAVQYGTLAAVANTATGVGQAVQNSGNPFSTGGP